MAMKMYVWLIFLVLAPKQQEAISDEKGVSWARSKRNFLQFGLMILCEVGRNPLDYNGYGCYCGLGGRGTPVDEIDECCYIHDQCYIAIEKSNICSPFPVLSITYKRDGCSKCRGYSKWYLFNGKNSRCMKEVCECDREVVQCYKKYNSKFRNQYKGHDQSKC
ncbi:phospholipase A2 A2-actitoxin-Cgg2a-like isoform X2 [Stylophora pistillata]|uniref:phospholipase A2 A2-actitoxin-Cgg2a-like isoform X2 n=1 Tax=Stylophora pistillata TaxID=50429 RepID=UPI000C05409C|nr:phospholipase A2 A2-actitoxin-Cgg2a-like isoform X2 [Stylophora pistillata]